MTLRLLNLQDSKFGCHTIIIILKWHKKLFKTLTQKVNSRFSVPLTSTQFVLSRTKLHVPLLVPPLFNYFLIPIKKSLILN